MSSLTNAFSSVNKWILKWPGLFGIPFYIFLFAAIAQAGTFGAGAALFYQNIATASVDAASGLGIAFSEAASFTANTAAPAISSVLENAIA